jgi:hypothetical protein
MMVTDDGRFGVADRAVAATPSSPQAVSPVPASIPSAGALKVWWIPQVPAAPFEALVPDLATAAAILDVLADYDAFQFRTNVKGDYCNAGGLMVLRDGEWEDWDDPETGDDFDQWRDENLPRFATNGWRDCELTAQAIEARQGGDSEASSVHESPVAESDAP